MRHLISARSSTAFLLVVCLLAAPFTALAKGKGDKNYHRGLQYEAAQQWERAAQEFALAVAAEPSRIEYQLHYRRAIFQASQALMQQGRALAEQGDYTGAYNAFRQAYGYDPVNELAHAEMDRMVRLQREKEGDTGGSTTHPANSPNSNSSSGSGTAYVAPTAYQPNSTGGARQDTPQSAIPISEQLRTIDYNGDLESFIRQYADILNLNVLFAPEFPKRNINIHLRDVTAAKALDHIFFTQNLFFQKLDRRTILVADQISRPKYQQLVLRTFYLSNANPDDARNLVQQALPAQLGRPATFVVNKATNSLTVRGTPDEINLIGELLSNIDKDRAEVVMDVNIYEVSNNDLLQLGNQFDPTALQNLGGLQAGSVLLGGAQRVATGAAGATYPVSTGVGLIIPPTTLSAFQSKDRTRLLASTQIHAFDNEASTTNIGEKVPVQTAAVSPYGYAGPTTGTTPGSPAVTPGLFSGGYPVIQYQDTGLTLKFTPQVFPNQDVQVKMEIESNDVIGGSTALTPTFSQRKVSGMARIPNNRTMMIASIAQDKIDRGRQGFPVLGLVPVFGRLFTTPTRSDNQSDIVITVTPRVLRAPVVTPEDEKMHPSGSQQSPIPESLEAVLQQADREDQLAAARSLPTNASVQVPTLAAEKLSMQHGAAQSSIPAAESPAFVPAPKFMANAAGAGASATADAMAVTGNSPDATRPAIRTAVSTSAPAPTMVSDTAPPKNSTAATVTGGASVTPPATTAPAVGSSVEKSSAQTTATSQTSVPAAGAAELSLLTAQPVMGVGQKQHLRLALKTGAPLRFATATLRFDPRVLAVRAVSKDGAPADTRQGTTAPTIMPSIDPSGALIVTVVAGAASPLVGEIALLDIEVEGVAAGRSAFDFDRDGAHLVAVDGHTVEAQLSESSVTVK